MGPIAKVSASVPQRESGVLWGYSSVALVIVNSWRSHFAID
jgi:hypothetical protein